MTLSLVRRFLAVSSFVFALDSIGLAAPAIATQPLGQTIVVGQSVTFTVVATGTAPSYQWRKLGVPLSNGVNVTGANRAALTIFGVSATDAGLYDVVVTDGTALTSNSARLDVRPANYPSGPLRPRPGFAPAFETTGTANAIVPAPGGAFYVVGNFTTVDGVPRSGVARFLASGALDTAFTPPIISGGPIRAAVLQGSGVSAKLIVGGDFSTVSGVSRSYVARLDAATGALDSAFSPATGPVTALALQSDGKLVVGGSAFIYRFDGVTGANDGTFTNINPFNNGVYSVALDNAGRILVGGSFTSYNGVTTNIRGLVRLSSTGVLDTAFAAALGGGLGSTVFQVNSIAVYPGVAGPGNGGKIAVGGSFTGSTRSYLTRLNDDGSVDAGFMSAGVGLDGPVNSIALQSDGMILVAGNFFKITGATVAFRSNFVRLDATTGAADGIYPSSGFSAITNAVAITTDGKVVVGGAFRGVGGSTRYGLARLDGTTLALDSSVSSILRIPGTVMAVAPVAGGKYAVTGSFLWVNQSTASNIAIIDAITGALDATFATNVGTGLNFEGKALAIQGDGQILVAGDFSTVSGVSRNRMARIAPSGVLDMSFNPTSLSGNPVKAIAVQADGNILVGGFFTGTVNATGVARLTPATGALDSSFVTGTGFLMSGSSVNALAIQPDGRILVGGNFTQFNGTTGVNCIARLNANGSLDTAFKAASGTGFVTNFLGLGVANLNVLSDGKILATGEFTSFNSTTRNYAARLSESGALDPTFVSPLSASLGQAMVLAAVVQGSPPSGDGKFIIGGGLMFPGVSDVLGIVRLDSANGARDTTISVPTLLRGAKPRSLTYADDGALLVGGNRFDFAERTAAGLVLLEPAPVVAISAQPTNQTGTLGGAASFSVAVTGSPSTYQWFKNGVAISGATGATHNIASVQVSDAGRYTVRVSNLYGAVTSNTATLSVVETGQLSNISTRAAVGTGGRVLISGFVITGTDPKPVLIRAVGPTLAGFGLTGLLADPVLELFRSDATGVAMNDTWSSAGDAAAIAATAIRVGAFALPAGSPEAVISTTLAPGSYTAQVRGAAAGTGVGLVEVYDAGTGTENSEVINISARGDVGTGGNILIAGFVIRGIQPKTVLIRGVGPALAGFGLSGVLDDPRLQLYRGTTLVNENDNATDPALIIAATSVGAFALPTGGRDAAILVALQPGAYTAQVSGVGGTTGIGLVEVYVVP